MVIQGRYQRLSPLECGFTESEVELFFFQKGALEITLTLLSVQALLVPTVPTFLPGKQYSCLTELEKSMSLYFFSMGLKRCFSLKENLAPVEALTEKHLSLLQVQIH